MGGHFKLLQVANLHKMSIGVTMWREATRRSRAMNEKYSCLRRKNDANKRLALMNEWKLLFEVAMFAKTKRLSECLRVWRSEFAFAQMEEWIRCNVRFHGMTK